MLTEKINSKVIIILYSLLIIFDFYFMYTSWGPYPPRNYLALLITFIAIFELRSLSLDDFFAKYKISFVIFLYPIAYWLLSYLFLGTTSYQHVVKDVFKYGALSFTMVYLNACLTRDAISKVILFTVGLSLIVAMLQYFYPQLGWYLRELIDSKTYHEMIKPYSRPSGLAFYTLTLAEQVLIAFPLSLSFFRKKLHGAKFWCLFFIITAVCVSLNNRGMIIGIFMSMIIIFGKKPNLKEAMSFLLVFILSFFLIYKYTRVFNFEPGSDLARIDALLISLMIIKDNILFGIGDQVSDIKELIVDYSSTVSKVYSVKGLGKIAPHNYFINTQLKYGLIGTFVNLYLFSKVKFSRVGVAIFISLTFNSLFHNGGFLNSSTIMIGYFVSLKFSQKDNNLSP